MWFVCCDKTVYRKLAPLWGFMGSRQLQVLPWEKVLSWLPIEEFWGSLGLPHRPGPAPHPWDSKKHKWAGGSQLPAVRPGSPSPQAASSASSAACPLAHGPRTVCGPGGRLAAVVTGGVWRRPAAGGQHQELLRKDGWHGPVTPGLKDHTL